VVSGFTTESPVLQGGEEVSSSPGSCNMYQTYTQTYSTEKIYESKSPKVVVLWVSRHPPLPAQIKILEEKFGSVAIYQMSGMVPNAEAVVEAVRKYSASVVVPVLPLSMIARLAELSRQNGFTVLLARMNNIATTKSIEEARRVVWEKPECRTMATYADGLVRVFEFERFEKLVEVKLVTEPL
jgi:hypothetical protein